MSSPYQAYGGPPSNDGYLYPPTNNKPYQLNSASTVDVVQFGKPEDAGRRISRTPSPTPSEQAELDRDTFFDWKKMLNWRFWFRREWLWYYVALVIILVLTALMTIYHTQIVHWLTPATNWMKNLTAGWLIPIAILFVISFPPLFGHEIVAILCGVVWGLWIGFAIVAAGTFLGELGTFYAFKYCCRSRGEKFEKSNISYACLAKVVREGGFKIVFLARLSAIPGHFTTAVFSTCGIGVITFSIAAILSLPKQFVTVYIGVLVENAGDSETTGQKIASDAVIAVTFVVTFLAMWYIYRQMGKVRHDIIHERRKARQMKLETSDLPYGPSGTTFASSTTGPFNPNGSETDIPLTAPGLGSQHQQWDSQGRAVGYAGDPRVYSPQPQRPLHTGTAGTGVGVQYPTSPRGDGRLPVRQESDDSLPSNPFADRPAYPEYSPPTIPPPPAPQTTVNTPRTAQYASPPAFAEPTDLPMPPFTAPPPPLPSQGGAPSYAGGLSTRTSPPPPSYHSGPF